VEEAILLKRKSQRAKIRIVAGVADWRCNRDETPAKGGSIPVADALLHVQFASARKRGSAASRSRLDVPVGIRITRRGRPPPAGAPADYLPATGCPIASSPIGALVIPNVRTGLAPFKDEQGAAYLAAPCRHAASPARAVAPLNFLLI
jgi:hypothetical protein